jgi:ABC-type glycerol-3-phosphate transport system substrate-binding protein
MAYAPPPGRGPLGGWGAAISAYSRNKEATWLLINYLTTPRIQKEYAAKGYAITAEALFSDPEIQKVYPYAEAAGQAMASGYPWPRSQESVDVFTIMTEHCNAVVVGQEEPEAAARAMDAEVLPTPPGAGLDHGVGRPRSGDPASGAAPPVTSAPERRRLLLWGTGPVTPSASE